MSPTDTQIVIVIPVFNDRSSCAQLLVHIKASGMRQNGNFLVDDGSISGARSVRSRRRGFVRCHSTARKKCWAPIRNCMRHRICGS